MTSYLVCYDYGQGGIWFYVEAQSDLELSRAYPALLVFRCSPPWWNEEHEAAARKSDPNTSPFKEILEASRTAPS
jgi:hypothetical protein